MLNYVYQFFKMRVVFHTLYLWNEVGDPNFISISDTSNSLSDCRKTFKKKSIDWKIFMWMSLTNTHAQFVFFLPFPGYFYQA